MEKKIQYVYPRGMSSTQKKANSVLHIIFVAFLLIGLRIGYLGLQKEDKLKEAQKPKIRTLYVRAERGDIVDRFGEPLATSKICYNAAIYYAQIQQIPSRGFAFNAEGYKIRTFPRKEHIRALSLLLEKELSLEASHIEDLIYAKASILPHVPLIVKSGITEKEYARLKMLEKDFPGLCAEIGSERIYPLGKVGCHIVGTLGLISSKEYASIMQEIRTLREIVSEYEAFPSLNTLPPEYESIDEVLQRLEVLQDKAYTFNDRVGKSGIERQFEEDLRGAWGVKTIEVDNQGKPIGELSPNKNPQTGNKIVLTISAELQKFAEELLIDNEKERDHKSIWLDPKDKKRKEQKQPWIKGGAIVAIDPSTGEILALASHPRFDPNDFIRSQNLSRWLESPQMYAALWDGRSLLERDVFKKGISEEKIPVSWDFYLEQVLPKEGGLKTFFDKVDDIRSFTSLQEDFQTLLFIAKNPSPEALMEAITAKQSPLWEVLKNSEEASFLIRKIESLLSPIASSKDRLFAIDLCRLCVDSPRFSDELLSKIGSIKIANYRALTQAFGRFSQIQKDKAFRAFHKETFPLWRKEHQKEFLAQKRREEKEKKRYAKPFTDYIATQEKELFSLLWLEQKNTILLQALQESSSDLDVKLLQKTLTTLPPHLAEEFLKTFRLFTDLDRPLLYPTKQIATEKDLASAFYPKEGFGFCRSYAFQATSPQGSLFKLIAAYEGLRQGHNFVLIDEQRRDPLATAGKQLIVAFNANKAPYPRVYRGGRLPKTAAMNVGKIDIVGALEHSSNPYFSILAGDYLKSPEDLNYAASAFGYGSPTGIDLPGEAGGNLPNDLKTNRTGLYSYAIGQHTLLNTPLQSAVAMAAIANGGQILKPQIVKEILSPEKIPTPMPLIKQSVFLPPSIRDYLIEGMDRSLWSGRGNARSSSIRALLSDSKAMHEYLLLQHQMIGKTCTSEIVFNPDTSPASSGQVYKHIWFGSIAFPVKAKWDHPELTVIVFLRFGSSGKDAAPLAAQMIQKWHEIQEKHKL
jgi:cell division protein FtsI/penicillin-binding protein 2